MKIAGIQKLTLVDFPGHVAATIFTQGCNFRCGFCHNPELVIPEKYNGLLSEKEIFSFLESRYGKLNGVCITGGEPCLQPDIDKFISHMRALGFDVKLDTNGSNPKMLEKIIKDGDVNYIAMDIKNSLKKYMQTVLISNNQFPITKQNSIIQSLNGVISTHSEPTGGWIEEGEKSQHRLLENIQKSINLIVNSGIDYEFRTTVCHPLHSVEDFHQIGQLISSQGVISSEVERSQNHVSGGTKAKKYFIQNFVQSKHINEHTNYTPLSDEELAEAIKIMKKFASEVRSR